MATRDQSIEYLIQLAEQAVFSGEYQRAMQLLMDGLSDEPGYSRLHYAAAWVYRYFLEDLEKAESHYKYAILFDAGNTLACGELAEMYLKLRKFAEFDALMQKAEQSDEIDRDFVYGFLGRAAEMQGKYKNAIRFYKQALISCMDNEVSDEIRANIRRTRFKRFTSV
jgi:tetratricopeptide (TPR) repeat protein